MAPPPRQQPADGKLGNISGTPAALSKWAEHYLPKVFAVDTRITGLIKRGSATDRGRTITLNLEHALCLMMGYLPKDLSLINPAPMDPAHYVTLLGSKGPQWPRMLVLYRYTLTARKLGDLLAATPSLATAAGASTASATTASPQGQE